jgi:hypothetical protein
VIPVPPSTKGFDHEFFPVVGTNEERLAAHGVVRKRLLEEIDALELEPPIVALDLTDALSDPNGWFREELHQDGVHPSAEGRTVAQVELRRVLASR